MNPGNSLQFSVNRFWNAAIERFSRAPGEKFGVADVYCLLGILASFAVGLAVSWQRWGNPLVDSGRELNVPLRLLHREMLYSDVGYIYGPLSPYLNASLYRLFHPSLWVLWGRGIAWTVFILLLTYWIARQITGRFPATISGVAVTWVCALKSQGTYMMAYSFGGLDGCMFVLATAALLILFLRTKSAGTLFFAGITAALAILAKTEFGGTAVATGIVAVTLAGYPRIRSIVVNLALFLMASLGIPALVFSWFAARVGWKTLIVDSHLFFGHVPWQLLYFNGLRFGFGHPWHSLGLMAASLLRLIAFGGLLLAISQGIAIAGGGRSLEARRLLRNSAGLLILSLAVMVISGVGLADVGPFIPMPVVLLLPVVGGVTAYLRATKEQNPTAAKTAGTIVIVAACASFSLARIVLRVSTGGALSSFLLPASIILFVYLWLEIFPLVSADPGVRLRCQQLVSVALLTALTVTAITLSLRYQRKFSYPLVSAMGTWRTTPELGVAFSQALQFVAGRTGPGEFIAVLPEGSSLIFLSGRQNPLREEIVTPGFLDRPGETVAIEHLRWAGKPLVLLANRATPEFAETAFGRDYNRDLMAWIETNYVVCGTFGTRPDPALQIGDPIFFIRAYCRR
jgi:hypothetical protein